MILTFTTTLEHAQQAQQLALLEARYALRGNWPLRVLSAVTAAIFGGLFLVLIGLAQDNNLRFVALLFAGSLIVVAILASIQAKLRVKVLLREHFSVRTFPIQTTISTDETGLVVSDASGSTCFPWARVKYLEKRDAIDVICMRGAAVVLLPISAYRDNDERSEFAELIKRHANGL